MDTMTMLPLPVVTETDKTPPKDKWTFSADNAGKWRWSLHTSERLLIRASSEAYANRGDAVKNAKQYGYREADTGTGSFPTVRRSNKKPGR